MVKREKFEFKKMPLDGQGRRKKKAEQNLCTMIKYILRIGQACARQHHKEERCN